MKIRLLILVIFSAAIPQESEGFTFSPAPLKTWTGQCERELERRGEVRQEGGTECTMYLVGFFSGAGETDTCGYASVRELLRSYIAYARESDQSRTVPQVTRDFVISSCASGE